MMTDRVREAVNRQLNREMESAHLYLSMSAYFASRDLDGFARWMRLQAEEERGHAMRLYDYLVDRDARVELGALERPKRDWDSPLEAFEDALEHERGITESVNEVAEVAAEERDRATENVMDWFVDEQVEEESTISGVVKRVRLAQDDPSATLMLDRELGERVAVDPGAEDGQA